MKNPGYRQVLLIGLVSVVMGSAAATAQTPLTPLASFTSSPNSLLQSLDGNFYGTSGYGAGSTFFRMTPAGTVTVLHTFTAAEGGGALTLGADGNFYGTTAPVFDPIYKTSTSNAFRLTPSGTLTLLAAFSGDVHGLHYGGLAHFGLQASDGYLYGNVDRNFCGIDECFSENSVFRMTFADSRTTLHQFNDFFSPPTSPSIDAEASDGNFYGTVFLTFVPFSPSSNNRIFRMTPAGVVTDVHVFTGGDDGEYGFVRFQGADGNLYGTTATGGTARIGAIFRLTPDGTFSILHSFTGGASDGALPTTFLEGTDGNFYGITTQGGPANLGTVFTLTPGGAFTLVHTFDESEGSPQSFLQGLDGHFYGTTATLAWRLPVPPITGTAPDAPTGLTAAPSGEPRLPRVSLTWTASSGATSYTIKRGTAPGAETTIAAGVKFSHWTDAVNVTGARLYYVVSAVNGAGASANSNEVSALVPARDSDFNGDGAADLLVFRPSAGAWYDRDTGLITTLGENGDVPLPGDYDGDGINDFAVFRPSTATWIILASSTGTPQAVPFGIAGDVPVPGDYDGDGKADLAVYRPSTGIWFIRQSSTNTIVTRALGVGGDIPVPSDYDGDRIIDVAVYRPTSGMWYIRKSSTGGTTSLAFQFGLAGDVPVPADYDGDGLSDVAVFRAVSGPSPGHWFIRSSATATLVMRDFGTGADLTVPGDYNGDGKVDLAVYRPSTGEWYAQSLALSSAVPYGISWGLPGDIPAVNVAIRNARTVIAGLPAVSSAATLIRGGDFDADGRGDISVYRPSTGAWYNLLSQTGYTAFTATAFGASSDTPVPGDYDGDGKSDLAVYTPSTGAWAIAFSGGGVAGYQWGLDGDVPVPADYDGDGRTDLAVFRPANGVWYILQSSTNYTTSAGVQWGLNGDVPVPGDYDGDGLTDLAVFRPATGEWHILTSSSGYTTAAAYQWGLNGDVAVPGDYDGDARTDLAIYRPANGTWYILKSSGNFATSAAYQWGLSDDIPVASDYDGDGRTDAAVYRPATGEWYLLHSATGFTTSSIHQWGLPGDVPIFKRP
jgi:uncharacterized repeat protein (TIGR03803 family)